MKRHDIIESIALRLVFIAMIALIIIQCALATDFGSDFLCDISRFEGKPIDWTGDFVQSD